MTIAKEALAEAADRFWSKVDKSGECWIWTAAKTRGYGRFSVGGRLRTATHVAYELEHGPLASGLFVCHRCDNPACVRPAHLFAGTHRENMADRDEKGRVAKGDRNGSRTRPERRPRGAANITTPKLTAEDVATIRKAYALGDVSQRALAAQFGVSKDCIGQALRGDTWRAA